MKTGAKNSSVSCLANAQVAHKKQNGLWESGSVFQILPISHLKIDPRYQRALKRDLIRKIMADYNPDLIGALLVSKRTDGYGYVIDGQHRLHAMRAMGEEDAPCLCYFGLTPEMEAKYFDICNGQRISIHSWDMWRAKIAGKEKMALDIMKAAADADFKIGPTTAKNTTAAISTLFRLYSRIGQNGIARMFCLLRFTWDGNKDSLGYLMVWGLGTLLYRAGNYVDDNHFVNKLRKVAPITIIQQAQLYRGDKGLAMARVLADEYRSKTHFIPHHLLDV